VLDELIQRSYRYNMREQNENEVDKERVRATKGRNKHC